MLKDILMPKQHSRQSILACDKIAAVSFDLFAQSIFYVIFIFHLYVLPLCTT